MTIGFQLIEEMPTAPDQRRALERLDTSYARPRSALWRIGEQ